GGIACTLGAASGKAESARLSRRAVPLIDITDLYHPPQDPGDNLDLIAAYALPEVELKAVILDVTQRYRRPYVNPDNPSYDDPQGRRDPGFIPVTQLNAIFGRNVPCAVGPFEPMRRPDDEMRDIPSFQQMGVDLLLQTLRESSEPVEIVSFGSARPLAVAYNREPALMREKTRCIHLAAGSTPPGFLEWNVQLDVRAFVRVLRSDLPLAIYSCAADRSAFDLGVHNTYWQLPDLSFIRRMRPPLRNYLAYAIDRSARVDFLNAIEDEPSDETMNRVCNRPHNVWETVTWMAVANRKLVRREDGCYRIIPVAEVKPGDTVLPCELLPCAVSARDDGQFDVKLEDAPSRYRIFRRANPEENQQALREALPALYESF
ncbi:MAG: hypothetical protein NTU83_02365, partial [Candidatus Hydrogenedentes bacterium]|nr:hypothetical protein [Candidatus Hydrogenedentota bacterium]